MKSEWDGIGEEAFGNYKQKLLSNAKYSHIKELLQETTWSDDPSVRKAWDIMKDMLSQKRFGIAVGIKDETALPINAALERPESREAFIQAMRKNPQLLLETAQAIQKRPDQVSSYIESFREKVAQPPAPEAKPEQARSQADYVKKRLTEAGVSVTPATISHVVSGVKAATSVEAISH